MKTQHLSFDIITTLPQPIIETILCLLPIEQAVRTSILSRNWRYKWTTIPTLVFHETTVKRSTEDIEGKQLSDLEFERRKEDINRRLFYAVHRVLFLHKGPLHEFDLSMTEGHTFGEVDQVILHLSRNYNVKKLTLDFFLSSSSAKCLPLYVFSFHHLTDLDLQYCDINHKPIIDRFGSLTSLSLTSTSISTKSLLHLLSNCPSLKRLYLLAHAEERIEDRILGYERPNIMELFKCLPVVEHLTTWDHVIQSFVLDSVPQELLTSLIHLKYFRFEDMGFAKDLGLPFFCVLLKCSPNLEKIKLEVDTEGIYVEPVKPEEISAILGKYSDIWLENLNELEIETFTNLQPELEIVKFILARSPNLKRATLLTRMDNKDEELELLNILLRAPGALPGKIIIKKSQRGFCC